uniref:Uncharacterized protein n=1 Tax=Oryza nivara TaxID=4536 RepID=A0A0E0FFM2_ORYNI
MQIVHNLLVSYDNYPSTGQQLRITRCGGGGVKKWKAVTSIKLREFEKEMLLHLVLTAITVYVHPQYMGLQANKSPKNS